MERIHTGREALDRLAPGLAAVLPELEAAMWRSASDVGLLDLADLTAQVVAAQHGLPPLRPPLRPGARSWAGVDPADWRQLAELDEAERAAVAFAEQMSFDVASVGESDRSALFAGLGGAAVFFVQGAWVADFLPRVHFALDALFGDSDWSGGRVTDGDARSGPETGAEALAAALDALIRRVPGLDALDPITTELVRLLGARRHRCRLCQSLRSRSALAAGADDAVFAAVDAYATSDLGDAPKAALAFAEAMVGVPGRVLPAHAAAVAAHFAPAARVELVLDVMRNATNKVAVALAADAPHVETGYEIYDVGPDGELQFGLGVVDGEGEAGPQHRT